MARNAMSLKINSHRCKACEVCIYFCPKSVLALGEQVNDSGYTAVVLTNEEKCNQCGLCQIICPDAALKVE